MQTQGNAQANTVAVLNASKLHKVSHSSYTAEVVMTALSQRERLRHFTDISRLKNALVRAGERIVDEDYTAYWKGLEEAGCGRIVFSKKGKQDRFFWYYSMKKVAQAALEGKNVPAERIEAKPDTKTAPKVNTKKAVKLSGTKRILKSVDLNAAKERQVLIPLRPDFFLEFAIPGNLSKQEIETIGRILSRLAS